MSTEVSRSESNDQHVIESLVEKLGSRDVAEREESRKKLQLFWTEATPALTEALNSPQERVRWEAAQALRRIKDPAAAPALVHALEDDEASIRWLAARALVALGRDALVPLLEELEQGSGSVWLRTGAHHVLHALLREGLADETEPVMEALENLEPTIEVPVAAYHALRRIRGSVRQ
jgi:HEAT repeat protein